MQENTVIIRNEPIDWTWKTFDSLTTTDVYDMLAVRQRIFIIEQTCIYQDADGFDTQSLHLFGRDDLGELIVYARLSAPGVKYAEPAIGRLLVIPENRGKTSDEERSTYAL